MSLELKVNGTNPRIDDAIFVVILNDECPRIHVEFVGVDESIVAKEVNRRICKIANHRLRHSARLPPKTKAPTASGQRNRRFIQRLLIQMHQVILREEDRFSMVFSTWLLNVDVNLIAYIPKPSFSVFNWFYINNWFLKIVDKRKNIRMIEKKTWEK